MTHWVDFISARLWISSIEFHLIAFVVLVLLLVFFLRSFD